MSLFTQAVTSATSNLQLPLPWLKCHDTMKSTKQPVVSMHEMEEHAKLFKIPKTVVPDFLSTMMQAREQSLVLPFLVLLSCFLFDCLIV